MNDEYEIQPLFDNVLCLPDEKEEKTGFGIIIPDNAKEATNIATVVAVGEGKYENGILIPMKVQVGNKILYKQWGSNANKIGGKEYLLIAQTDILSILKPKKHLKAD
jgi:chaperonin GroES